MTIAVDTIVADAARLLGDVTNIAYDVGTLVNYANEAEKRIAHHVDGAYSEHRTLPVVAGASQSIGLGSSVVKIWHLEGLREVSKKAMVRENVNWEDDTTASDTGSMWMRHEGDNHQFYLYPPRIGSGTVWASVKVIPDDFSLGDNISIPDEYGVNITDYIVYRCLSEDTDLAEPGRAEHFLTLYREDLFGPERGE